MPIKGKKELEKKAFPRGTADVLYQADQVLVVRKDSKAVYMAKNIHGADMEKTCLPIQQGGEAQSLKVQVCLY